jgi:hypothetical protein
VLAVWLKLKNIELPPVFCKPVAFPCIVVLLLLDKSRPVQNLLPRAWTTSTSTPSLDGVHCAVALGVVCVDVTLATSLLVGVGPDGVTATWKS